jgi:hypothetical protein
VHRLAGTSSSMALQSKAARNEITQYSNGSCKGPRPNAPVKSGRSALCDSTKGIGYGSGDHAARPFHPTENGTPVLRKTRSHQNLPWKYTSAFLSEAQSTILRHFSSRIFGTFFQIPRAPRETMPPTSLPIYLPIFNLPNSSIECSL